MKKGIALPFPALCGCSRRSCVSCRKSRLLLTYRHGLWHSCGAGRATEGCVALPFPSLQVTKVSARGEVSDARCQEAGAQPAPVDRSRNTAPGREQREGERWGGGKEEDDLQAQPAATGSVPGKNLTQLPPDQGTSALPGEREEQPLLESSTTARALQSARRSTQLVSRTLCAGAHQEVFFWLFGNGLSLPIHSFFTMGNVWFASVLRRALLVASG